ncbi:hypothetical protein [Phaeacidiphilus oryzae]|uniref:hypothetical protein n=1 Tax=Phaeacidiphilus oryzae TaxID=348818 RepID=UPI000690AA62|nr:hypothetical protein [Phaeacidiphilus oryzae]
MLNSAQADSALISGYWWWYLMPSICVALVGIALALLNFGIDEVINPRLRSARRRRGGPRFELGLTPVVRTRGAAGAATGTAPGSGTTGAGARPGRHRAAAAEAARTTQAPVSGAPGEIRAEGPAEAQDGGVR